MKLVVRALVTGAIEVGALLVMAAVLPGVSLTRWDTAILVIVAIAALNALVRPLIVLLAVNLPLLLFGALTLSLNVIIVVLASALVPGFELHTPWAGLLVALGLSLANTVFTSLLSIDDEDSFYRYVIQHIARRRLPQGDLARTGTVIVQIDGLAEAVLRHALARGLMPTLARWLASGSHRLVGWECDVPSMTSSGQAGILHGNNANIPAFRWYEKESRRLFVSNHPADARLLDERQSIGQGLLRHDGSSLGNIFRGGAEHSVLTMSALTDHGGGPSLRPRDFYSYLANPYNLYRALTGMLVEIVVEYWEAWQQRRRHVEPRMDRGGAYPFLRAVTNVFMRDATVWLAVDDMYAGRLVSYSDLLGYDEVAHHAGPESEDALRVLRGLDRQLAALERAARTAPRRYELVVLSDHGQSQGATFRQRYGLTLGELIHRILRGEESVHLASGHGEGWAHLNAVLSEIVQREGAAADGIRRLLGERQADSYVDLGPDRAHRAAGGSTDVVVCASGNLALVYFTNYPGRVSLERIVAAYPGLVESLVRHPGIGFVLVRSEARGPLVLGPGGARYLDGDAIEGEDPLALYDPHTARFLRRLSTYPNVGDLVVNSAYDPATGEVAAFEELIGCHGGAGGLQTRPFLLFPSRWTATDPAIVGAEAVHAFLSQYVAADLASGEPLARSAEHPGHVS
ncbi:MAG TPA: phage holin family protein [Chloroflexota bacterium]|nr:phage holin family protein [Chloroflexota bacterium]